MVYKQARTATAVLVLAFASPSGSAAAPAAATKDPPFVEAAEAAGIHFVHDNGMSGHFYMVEMMGPGVGLFDYDRDGDLDLVIGQGRALGEGSGAGSANTRAAGGARLFRNDAVDGEGTLPIRFVDVTESSKLAAFGYSQGVVVGDIDGDAWPDLYLANWGENEMWRNRGDGTFEDVTFDSGSSEARWSTGGAFIDFDLDGDLDLFVLNYINMSLANHHPCYSKTSAPDYCGPSAYDTLPDRLLRNRGDGTFEDATVSSRIGTRSGSGLGVVVLDADLDGWPDLYVANDQMENRLWINQGDGTFLDQALLAGCAVNIEGTSEASMGVAVQDFDRDGDEDVFLTHLQGESNTLYVNLGEGMFEDQTMAHALAAPSWDATGFGVGWLDFDQDGSEDLFVANGAVKVIESQRGTGGALPLRQADHLYRGGSNGMARVELANGIASAVGRAVAFGDLDNDLDADIVVGNNAGSIHLLINQAGKPENAARLDIRAAAGAAQGVAARIRLPDGSGQLRRVRRDGSFGASSDPRLLISPGDDGSFAVEIVWGDDSRIEWRGLGAGQSYILDRGQ